MRSPAIEVEQVPLASLKAYDGNAKRHDRANVDAIAESIKEFGFRNPILAWHNEDGVPEIVAGHGRAAAAKKLCLEDVPVVFVDDLTDAQRRMLTLADNQTTLMTGWDEEQLAAELDALMDAFDVTVFGFELPSLEGDEQEDGVEEFATAIDLHHEYIVLKFDNEIDFNWACGLLGVRDADLAATGKKARKGIGRVIDGVGALRDAL